MRSPASEFATWNPVVVVVVSTQKKSGSSSRSLVDNFSAIATSPTLTAWIQVQRCDASRARTSAS